MTDSLPRLIAYRLFDAAADAAATPRLIHRLADAYRLVASTQLALARHAAILDNDRKKATDKNIDELFDRIRRYGQCVKQHQLLQAARAPET